MTTQFFWVPLMFVMGACLGSFINVVTMRFGTAQPSIGGRSRCGSCGRELRWWELVPVVSYLMLRGRCARCRERFSPQYPLVEIAGGLLAAAVLGSAEVSLASSLKFLIVLLLFILFLIDLRTFILPDFYVLLLGVLAAVLYAYDGQFSPLSLVGGVLIGAGFLLFLWLVTRARGIGLGDVKLGIPLGMLFGASGITAVLFLSFIIGGAVGMMLLLTKQATPKTAIPFGPFLTGAAILLLLYPGLLDIFQLLVGV